MLKKHCNNFKYTCTVCGFLCTNQLFPVVCVCVYEGGNKVGDNYMNYE